MKTTMPILAGLLLLPLLAQEAPPAFENEDPDPFSDPKPIQIDEGDDHFDPFRYAPKVIRVQVELIEIPHKTLTKLMMAEKSKSSDATALRMKVQKIVEDGQGKVLETMMTYARNNERTNVESLREFLYPTEFDPPQLENNSEDITTAFPVGHATPRAYETRSVGSTLTVEPHLDDNQKIIELRFVPELVWHTGNTVWHEFKEENDNVFKASMPDFYTLRSQSALTCMSGQYHLMNFFTPKTESGKSNSENRIMLFIKCDVQAVME